MKGRVQVDLQTFSPIRGSMRDRLADFLCQCGLDLDPGVQYTVCLTEDEKIAATGSLDGRVLKCIAVSPEYQGQDLSARIMTELCQEAFRRGEKHLLLFTKPGNESTFRGFGFFPILHTRDCLLMENQKNGLEKFLESVKAEGEYSRIGCIVANCDPMTNGHLYLIRQAAKQCDHLYVFVLSENKGCFDAAQRLAWVRESCRELKNVSVHPSGPYMISAATFPDYFIRDKERVDQIRCEMDIRIFCERIAPVLGITTRFVGTEPFSPTTNAYNGQLKKTLPAAGLALCEIERLPYEGRAVSATRVRELWRKGKTDALKPLVPTPVFLTLKALEADKEV